VKAEKSTHVIGTVVVRACVCVCWCVRASERGTTCDKYWYLRITQ